MNEDNTTWEDIDKAKNMLLTRSDWTQLPDSQLTKDSVMKFRSWRQYVREVTESKFKERIPAKIRLQELMRNRPNEQKIDNNSENSENIENYLDVQYDSLHIKKLVKEILENELKKKTIITSEPECESVSKIEKSIKDIYLSKIKEIAPDSALSYMYSEKLNQAIDCLCDQGSKYPLLECYGLDVTEVAKDTLNDHRQMINRFAKVERCFIVCTASIKECSSIEEMKIYVQDFKEELDGY